MQESLKVSPSASSLSDYVNQHGSKTSDYFRAAEQDFSALAAPDIADMAHFLCVLHGRHPGVVDHAATKTVEPAAREWLVKAMEGFAGERAFLTKLTVAAGPISGVSEHDQSNATVAAQRKALEMLSQSDRDGCAIGASFALVLDWQLVRPMLEKIAIHLGVEPRPTSLPNQESTETLNDILRQSSPVDRAIKFGVDQLLNQHRGLWDLLRRSTRSAQSSVNSKSETAVN